MVQYFTSLCTSLEDSACTASELAVAEVTQSEPSSTWSSSRKPTPGTSESRRQSRGGNSGGQSGGPAWGKGNGGGGGSAGKANQGRWGSKHPRPEQSSRVIPWSITRPAPPVLVTAAQDVADPDTETAPVASLGSLLEACAGMERLSMGNDIQTAPQPPEGAPSEVLTDEFDLSLFSGLTLGPNRSNRSISDPANTSSTSSFSTPLADRSSKRQLETDENALDTNKPDKCSPECDSASKRAHLAPPHVAEPE